MSKYDDKLEMELERYRITEDFTILHGMLKASVKGKSIKYFTKYRKKGLRVHVDDFESYLWEGAVDLVQSQGYWKRRFRVVLNYRLESRAKNCIRDLMTDANRPLTSAVELFEESIPNAGDISEVAIANVMFEQLSNDVRLNDQEQQLVRLIWRYPDASNSELANLGNFNHNEKVRRLKETIRRKGWRHFDVD